MGCSSKLGDMDYLPAHIKEKVYNHPCYSQEAHHYYARMHVAVAPACNIQCNYCNRKYDCANESRPGVVSEVLTPEEAVKKVMVVGMTIPQMTVVGVAGPGDSLADGHKTFKTFQMLREKTPDIKLCLSTNGLLLVEYIDKIKELNIDHVTITINAITPETASKIYPWIFYKHKRYRGIEAAKILLEKQYEGLRMCVENNILVKVNSVFIPEINGEELVEVSKKVKDLGAFLHNIMPLISKPEYGTKFGLDGIREPTNKELKNIQDRCSEIWGSDFGIMRHCRQCRADAVGLLGEDRGEEFTKDKFLKVDIDYDVNQRREVQSKIEDWRKFLKEYKEIDQDDIYTNKKVFIAVASTGKGIINQHFGHAKEFLIYEVSKKGVKFVQVRKVQIYCKGGLSCVSEEESENILEETVKILSDCKAVLCARIGFEPRDILTKYGIEPVDEKAFQSIEKSVWEVGKKYILKKEKISAEV
ncbi:MAG: nitrogenase cofactor biosynthesis protein NifB [Hydrogenothermaceae bacterium]|nr:nitrogenase cofactor biosynthesis protein NifB [Hydrogenothermaceae bacterium]